MVAKKKTPKVHERVVKKSPAGKAVKKAVKRPAAAKKAVKKPAAKKAVGVVKTVGKKFSAAKKGVTNFVDHIIHPKTAKKHSVKKVVKASSKAKTVSRSHSKKSHGPRAHSKVQTAEGLRRSMKTRHKKR